MNVFEESQDLCGVDVVENILDVIFVLEFVSGV